MDFGFSPIPIFDLLFSLVYRPVSTTGACASIFPFLSMGAVKGGGGLGTSIDRVGIEIQSILIIQGFLSSLYNIRHATKQTGNNQRPKLNDSHIDHSFN